MGGGVCLNVSANLMTPNRDERRLSTLSLAIPKTGTLCPLYRICSPIRVVLPGLPNPGEGPDFTHAKILIGDTLWAGAVELHLIASYWYHHRHHLDKSYDSVIFHVVWDNDAEVCYPCG